MQPFTTHRGMVAVLNRSDVDTDQIIPKQFLKRIERTGFGQFLFNDWRFREDGSDNPDFELNLPENRGASILVSGRNFGSGSSREHAVWALADFGFRCIIAESNSDIFYNNCFKNGLLPVILDGSEIRQIIEAKAKTPDLQLTIDLQEQSVTDGNELRFSFEIDPVRRHNMLNGFDDIDLTLQHAEKIAEFEAARNMTPVTHD